MEWRLFIACELPDEVRSKLARTLDNLKKRTDAPRWVRAESIHLTVKFLGDTPTERIPEIEGMLLEAAARSTPHSVTLKGLGVFPNLQRPRVLWGGLHGELEPLHALHKAVCARLGWEKRPFTPHLTLARIKSRKAGQQAADLVRSGAYSGAIATWHINSVSLMRSDLQPTGAVYTCLRSFPLGKTA
ncbi:MAG: RNA 2',3'-cyclic phosphodiesterase [Chloroflexi bacterium]|nr:RNA 2',3'-cyclic phosphodiesterase [Chloroflexota bacterium]